MDKELIVIGQIVNTQGHKGEVRVVPLTDFPKRFQNMETALIDIKGKIKEFHIESVRNQKKFVVIKFKELTDMNQAEGLKNCYIKIKEDELVELDEGTYYVFQLLEADVYNEDGMFLGKIADIFSTGANDVYLIKDDHGKELLVPATKNVVKEIDIQNKKVIISPLDEY